MCIKKCSRTAWNQDYDDDELWKRGFLVCPIVSDMKLKDGPPKDCPYRLEHLVIFDKNDE